MTFNALVHVFNLHRDCKLRCALAQCLSVCLLFVVHLPAQAAPVLPGPLVDVQWLHQHASEVQIVDIRDDLRTLMEKPSFVTVRGQQQLDQVGGYIPEALSVNFWSLRKPHDIAGQQVDLLLPTAAEFETTMRSSALESGRPVVLVPTGDDATSLQEAAFLAWELEWFGVPRQDIAILNGGTHAWIAAGYEVESYGIAAMESSQWRATASPANLLADVARVQQAQSSHTALWDARPLAQFVGVDKTAVIPRYARLRGAQPLPSELLYHRASDGSWRFLTTPQYQKVLASYGLKSLKPGPLYCNTGQYAAGAWFVLARVMGASGFSLYPGGMNEWLHRGLPTEPGME